MHQVKSESRSVVSDSLRPHGLYVEFSRPEYWSGWPFPSPGDLPDRGIEFRSPALQVDSFPAEPPAGVGSLSLLQGIFPTKVLNSGVPHCRWIPYQLSHTPTKRHGLAGQIKQGPQFCLFHSVEVKGCLENIEGAD